MVLKGRKLRLYPNKEQDLQLRQMCGNERFVWNSFNGMFVIVHIFYLAFLFQDHYSSIFYPHQ